MILSSINFLKASTKPKLDTDRQFTDFIIEKIKEEQDRRDASIGVTNSCCVKKSEMSGHTKNMSRNTDLNGPPRVPPHTTNVSDDVVSIETGDGYYFSIHNMYNRLQLSDTETPNKNCVFHQRRMKSSEEDSKKVLAAFHLNHDKTKYISVGTDKRIEISANDSKLDPSHPDDRFFVIHEIDNGTVFIQPYHHKGCYFHHLDNELKVSKFELNYRPPEEFFFRINKINVLETEMSSASSMSSSITTEDTHHQTEVTSTRTGNSQLHKSQNVKHSSGKVTHKPSLFRGCFGLVSKQEKKQKKKC